VATIEKQDGDLSQEYPASARMIEARKATFADKWPHKGKKGWKCKVKQVYYAVSLVMVDVPNILADGGCRVEIYSDTRV